MKNIFDLNWHKRYIKTHSIQKWIEFFLTQKAHNIRLLRELNNQKAFRISKNMRITDLTQTNSINDNTDFRETKELRNEKMSIVKNNIQDPLNTPPLLVHFKDDKYLIKDWNHTYSYLKSLWVTNHTCCIRYNSISDIIQNEITYNKLIVITLEKPNPQKLPYSESKKIRTILKWEFGEHTWVIWYQDDFDKRYIKQKWLLNYWDTKNNKNTIILYENESPEYLTNPNILYWSYKYKKNIEDRHCINSLFEFIIKWIMNP